MKKLEFAVALALVALICFQNSESAKINTPRVLLPWFENMYVNFTFEIIEGGCYTWSLSRDDIIDIEPLYEDSWGQCSRAARVSVSKRSSPPGTVIILAEEVNTGEILRGDVDIDVISHIKVMSTTWKLYLEEAPEAFEVVAYDDQGNTFSTLDGISFDWSIQNIGSDAGEIPILSLVQWRDTDYEAPTAVADLEALGLHSYNVLLYGQAMGECQVTSCLKNICTDFTLNVVASVVLMPSTATIAPGDTLKYRVVRARAGRLTVQEIADTLYYLRVPDTTTASLEDSISLVRAGTVGTTNVVLMSGATEVATAVLHVEDPHSIKVTIRENLVIRGEEFLIHCIVLDVNGRPLMSGDGTLIRLTVSGGADVDLLRSNENGTYTEAVARNSGPLMVDAKLYSVAGKVLSKKVEGHVTAVAIDPLEVVPRELYVAWTDTAQDITLNYRGGGDEPVAWGGEGVTPAGVLAAPAPGRVDVLVHLTKHSHVSATGRVYTLEADYMQLSGAGQARVGRPYHLHVALTGTHPETGELFNFHSCNCASFSLTLLEGPEPFNVTAATDVQPMEGACCVLSASWAARGASAVRAARGRLGAAARVLVRAAPSVLWPQRAAALVGATMPLIALGEALEPRSSDAGAVELTARAAPPPHSRPDALVFTVHCAAKGESRLELISQIEDEMESAEVEASCAPHVSRIRLDPPETQGNCSAGPRLWLRPHEEARVYVTLLDSAGRALHDERGPRVAWAVAPARAGVRCRAAPRLLVETHPEYAPVAVPLRYYQIVVADSQAVGWTGSIKASAPDASASIQAQVIAPLAVDPVKINIAWESESIANIATVTGGSGRYSVESAVGVAARVDGGALAATVPGPGYYELVVSDVCVPEERLTVEVNIEEILSVEVSAPRAVCVGSCVPVAALVRGVSHRYLQTSNAPQWQLSANVHVRDARLCGVAEGAASVRAAYNGVWSTELEIVVYPPLQISPSPVRLPPRARLQLRALAGPPPRLAALHYEVVEGGTHAEVSPQGLLLGVSAGAARVRLVARDADGEVMTSAEADVEVIPVTNIQVHSSTNTLLVGAPAALRVSAERLGARALAALPGARVAWAVRGAARLYAGIVDDKIERTTAEGLAVRVVPLEPGVIVIEVKIKNMGQPMDSRTWEKSLEILAIDDIHISVDGRAALSSDRVALAVGATVRLKSSPRSEWVAVHNDGVLSLTAGGELTALRAGHGVAVARHRDERSNVFRETALHIESSVPHYVTAEPADEAIELVMRSAVGRELLAPGANASATRDYSAIGPKLVLTGAEAGLTTFLCSFGGQLLKDRAWVDAPDHSAMLVVASTASIICLPGSNWRGPAGAALYPGAGAAACTPRQPRGALTLRATAPDRRVDVHLVEVEKLEFPPGEWPPQFVPLRVATPRAPTPTCDAALAAALAGARVPPPHACRARAPHAAEAAVRLERGELGCTLTPGHAVDDVTDVELCAELGSHRACTTLTLLPLVTVSADKVSLLEPPATFTVSGHPRALRLVELTPSPGLRFEQTSRSGEVTVTVLGMDTACGLGWVRVQCASTGQDVRVHVQKDCEVACGTILGAIVALLRPYFATMATFAAMAAAYFYVQSRLAPKAPITFPTPPSQSVLPPAEPGALNRSTWSRSPYSPRGPASPVYGDATVLPDQSFSPHATRMHSSFL